MIDTKFVSSLGKKEWVDWVIIWHLYSLRMCKASNIRVGKRIDIILGQGTKDRSSPIRSYSVNTPVGMHLERQ